MINLTPKQEGFAQSYIETGNASEAYRRNYSCEGWTENALNANASATLHHHKVSVRVNELRGEIGARRAVTVDSICAELDIAREIARENQQASAYVQASMAKAKLHGLILDKTQMALAVADITDADQILRNAGLIE